MPVERGYVVLTPESEERIVGALLSGLEPLRDAGKMGALLLQLSPAFSPGKHALEELDSLRALLDGHALAVELRNRDWVSGERLDATLAYLRERRISFVMVDAPDHEHFTIMPGLNAVTNPALAYFRAHGRNARGYISGRSVAERFDYDYSDAEVDDIAARLQQVEPEVSALHIVANNNRSSYAPKLAERLARKLAPPRIPTRKDELF